MKNEEHVLKAVQALWKQQITLDAKMTGIAAGIAFVAQRSGVPVAEVLAKIDSVANAEKEKQLIRLEDKNPGLAAEMDDYSSPQSHEEEPPTVL
jgi:hypothetical protein